MPDISSRCRARAAEVSVLESFSDEPRSVRHLSGLCLVGTSLQAEPCWAAVLMPRGPATVHRGRVPSGKQAAKGKEEGKRRTGQGERWLSLGSLPQHLRLRDVSGRGRPAGGAGLNPHALLLSPVACGGWGGAGLSRWAGGGVPGGRPPSGAVPHLCAPDPDPEVDCA